MNTEKLNYAMHYISDDFLMEFFQMDDKLTAERSKARQRTLKRFVAAACVIRFYNRSNLAYFIKQAVNTQYGT